MRSIELTDTAGSPCTIYVDHVFALLEGRSRSTTVISPSGAEVKVQENREAVRLAIQRACDDPVDFPSPVDLGEFP